MKTLAVLFLTTFSLFGQVATAAPPPHQVTLTWNPNNPAVSNYNVLKATIATSTTPCPTTVSSYTSIASPTVTTYVDTAVVAAVSYCYALTATLGTQTSSLSVPVVATIPVTSVTIILTPTGLAIQVQ